MDEEWLDIIRSEPCITCGAEVGKTCVTMNTGNPTANHAERIRIMCAKDGRYQFIPIGGFSDIVDRG